MHQFVRQSARQAARIRLGALALLMVTSTTARSQTQTGIIAGRMSDSAGHPLAGSVAVLGNARFGATATLDGSYVIPGVPAGSYRLVSHYIGFRSDTVTVVVVGGRTVSQRIVMRSAPSTLETVTVSSPRLNQTTVGALQEQKQADNIVTVQSGDQIRSLPNYNAAEALARMPGVTAERDEGEGKFVEIRGTPPLFQHVTIDGADVPGTLRGDRSVKLDDVPADVLGALEVHKTLSADMDAAAIGGSVNLVTKIPEGSPGGYASGYYGYQTLESNNNGHGDLSYGGRIGADQKLGFLLDGSIDRTDRVINDVEPSWQAVAPGRNGSFYNVNGGSGYTGAWPSWSEREYNYYRTRYGAGGDLDYRFSPTSSVYVKGLWSAFFDEANRWITGLGGSGLQMVNGVPTVTGASVSPFYSNRGPIEHTWGFTGGGRHDAGVWQLAWAANYAGSSANQHDHYDDSYAPLGGNRLANFTYGYDGSRLIPRPVLAPGVLSDLHTASDYALTQLNTDNERTSGSIVGGRLDALLPYTLGRLPASLKLGLKIQNQHKGYLSNQPSYRPDGSPLLSEFPSSYRAPSFYGDVCAGCYPLAPFGSIPAVNQNLVAHPGAWTFTPNTTRDALATFAGTEQVTAAYGMQTLDVRNLHVNVGVRVENTRVGYVGHGEDSTGALLADPIHGSHSYTDLFPSLQLRYALGENTNLRAAFTRGIARPNYSQLAPSFNAAGALPVQNGGTISSAITVGNPDLRPEYAWNSDLLAEHYFNSVGVLSAGLFYKDIRNFIFNRTGFYSGPIPGYAKFFASTPENGPSADLWGFELDYMQHLTFLPGVLRGVGFDVNWTHVESRAIVPQDTTAGHYLNALTGDSVFPYRGQPFRHAALPRQFPTLLNLSLLYDDSRFTARISGQYTSASIYGYGQDGTSNPTSGDNWNYAHWQLDAAATYTLVGSSAITLQALNLTNSVFGFFNGTTRTPWNVQREYYGTTLFIGVRQGF